MVVQVATLVLSCVTLGCLSLTVYYLRRAEAARRAVSEMRASRPEVCDGDDDDHL